MSAVQRRAVAREGYAAADPSYGEVASATFAAQDQVLLALLNGQASVGDANQALAELDQLSRQAWASATAAVGQRLAGAHAAEVERRQASALALQQWSLRQQRPLAVPNRPTTTTCRDMAGTLTCDTF